MKKIELAIKGMHCKSCAKMIEMELGDKVNKVKVEYEKGKAHIDFDEDKISEKQIRDIIKKGGYEAA